MFKEKIIQRHVENLIKKEGFFEAIHGVESADASMYSIENESFIPNFPIDYLMRKRCLEAAEHVLGQLSSLQIVSASANNISLHVGERLFPDVICCDVESGSLVLIEIKRSKKTERETATEILAYEHEVRNHFPFLSNLDICHVIIASNFDSLLDHSVAGMITWGGKQILCLRASYKGGKLDLSVHIPNVWTSIGQKPIPEVALVTVDLYLYPLLEKENPSPRDILRVAETALNLFARDGDRYQSHGFVMLWQDLLQSRENKDRLALTIGFINPYHFMGSALASNFVKAGRTKLVDYISKALTDFNICPTDSVLGMVCKQGKSILEEVSDPCWETFSTWQEIRTPILDPNARMQGLHYRALPIQFEFWGAIGDFARQYITMPAVRQSFNPLIGKRKLDWRDPIIAIEILDRLIGSEVVKNGRFTCSAMFWVGIELGSFATIVSTIQHNTEEGLSAGNMPALLTWYGASFASAMREFGFRWESIVDDMPAPPTVKVSEEGLAKVEEITALANWICAVFLEGNDLHQNSFNIGLQAHALLNPYFVTGVDEETAYSVNKSIVDYGRAALNCGAKYYNEALKSGYEITELQRALESFGVKRNTRGFNISRFDEVTDSQIIESLTTHIIDIFDRVSHPVAHHLASIAKVEVDWEWMKSQAKEMRLKGWHPAVLLTGDGGFSVHDAGVIGAMFSYDTETEIIFTNEIGGSMPLTIVTTWDKLMENMGDIEQLFTK
ncbi:hypothetical protein [Prosthecobacter fluviatilis]|uniref:Uncharacterized protein n=1 Tax=Prosthecobacter fluviatilis TaxID=445931 RepID=A0ABW0KQC4_9BACT